MSYEAQTNATNVGANKDIFLKGKGTYSKTLIRFKGSTSGNVTVTARVKGGTRFNAVTDGVVDLSAKDYASILNISVDAIHVAYDGVAQLDVEVLQTP